MFIGRVIVLFGHSTITANLAAGIHGYVQPLIGKQNQRPDHGYQACRNQHGQTGNSFLPFLSGAP
jgi:hypothetical protein